ncbi:unnamed protein product, partial [Mycena citricolor]
VLVDCLWRPVGKGITGLGTSGGYIIDVRDREFRDFGLKYNSDVVMEYRDRIGPPHRQGRKLLRSKGGLEREIEDTATCTSCKLLGQLICQRWHARVLNGNGVERLEAV